MARKKGLGKGLDALLGGASQRHSEGSESAAQPVATEQSVVNIDAQLSRRDADSTEQVPARNIANAADKSLVEVPVDLCRRGVYQPRRDMDQTALEELAASIKAQGVMQPIVIRPLTDSGDGSAYEIIAGERRWRAAQLAGLETVPAVVRVVADETAIALALIENLQREDLSPIEEAFAMQRLQQEFELTHQQVADAVGKSRAAVSNLLRLLSLEIEVRVMLENGDLEMGHARALLSLSGGDQIAAARDTVNKGLSVRQTEDLAKRWHQPKANEAVEARIDPNIARLQSDLADKLGVPVVIQHADSGKGKLVLKYNSLDELDGILEHIK